MTKYWLGVNILIDSEDPYIQIETSDGVTGEGWRLIRSLLEREFYVQDMDIELGEKVTDNG